MTEPRQLARRLGTGDAVVIGLGSMIGAGGFSAVGPAAAAAGAGLLIGLAVAAAAAYCNAVASAQLAAQYPTSGGTYVYGRERLGAWWGFIAGWGFVIGKTASCAAMPLTFASYAVAGPRWVQRLVALAAVVALSAANYRGISRTARLTRVLVAVSVLALLVVIATIATSGNADASRIGGLSSLGRGGLHGVLQAAGLLFFAFAGYARIATLGEEVRDPARTIPRAIPLALAITVALYLAIGVVALAAAGPTALAASTRPLATAVRAVGESWALPVVRIGAAVASLGALLALIAGIGRTGLAMARNGDLARVGARHLSGTRPRRARGRGGGGGARVDDRPARGDRVLFLRGARLLRSRQRLRIHSARSEPPLAARPERRRARCLHRVGGVAPRGGDPGRSGDVRGRRCRPGALEAGLRQVGRVARLSVAGPA